MHVLTQIFHCYKQAVVSKTNPQYNPKNFTWKVVSKFNFSVYLWLFRWFVEININLFKLTYNLALIFFYSTESWFLCIYDWKGL